MDTTIEQAAQHSEVDVVTSPLVAEFVQLVVRHVSHLPEPLRSERLRAVASAIQDPAPNLRERVMAILFPEGGAA